MASLSLSLPFLFFPSFLHFFVCFFFLFSVDLPFIQIRPGSSPVTGKINLIMAYLSSFLWLGGNPTRWKSMFMSSSTAVRCLSTLQCWSCKATCGTVFCPLCRVPQPTTPRLNYYELLVPEKARTPSSKGIHFWRLSLNKLHHEFISLQRLIHPDVFAHHEDTVNVEKEVVVVE
ncbi:hypothetical protein HMI55_005537 [Coelomomyces lativittatus]|nr:hypothetical protein HMI55_005537 [Coelomomyces lativittatus]